jgi:hypothetical protein
VSVLAALADLAYKEGEDLVVREAGGQVRMRERMNDVRLSRGTAKDRAMSVPARRSFGVALHQELRGMIRKDQFPLNANRALFMDA